MIFPDNIAPAVYYVEDLSNHVKTYLPADREVLFNEDDDVLRTITYKLPIAPEKETIDGYGLPAKKQFFRRPKMPTRLEKLVKDAVTIDEVWTRLNKYQKEYAEEWEFIKQQWDRRINGYWFYNNGKPTYIDGWHYVYISWWKLDVGFPEYRSRDRKFFLFARFTYTTTMAFYPFVVELITSSRNGRSKRTPIKHFSTRKEAQKFIANESKSGKILQMQEGEYFVDMKRRVCYGFNYPKHRREGATYKSGIVNYLITTGAFGVNGGLQSMDGLSGKKAFLKAIIKPWKKLPFFYKPRYDGSTNPKNELNFDVPAVRIGSGGSIASVDVGLESSINFADSASRQFYDGDKLCFLNNDECGKTTLENVKERWDVQKKCLAQGNGVYINGLAFNTSTVGEMSEKGGAAYKNLCNESMYDRRNSLGQTTSGLYNLFIPAYDGLEGFIDIFGDSIIENPSRGDLWRIRDPYYNADGKLLGAKEYLESVREDLLLRDDPESIKSYEEEVRLHPFSFSECFITAGSGSGLNLKKIVKRIKELEFDNTITQRGNFKWKGGIRDTEVEWDPDPINGKWIISLVLPPGKANQRVSREVMDLYGNPKMAYSPMYPGRFTASGDAYKFRKTEGKRLSNGGGNVFMERDPVIDYDGRPLDEWETYRNVCTYNNRPPDPEDYAEDMLMMCVYYGAMMYPEIDIPLLWDYFVKRGYDGYLKYHIDTNGVMRKTPGYNMRGGTAQQIMMAHQQYIENHAHRERHLEILLECKTIKGVEDITNHDLFAAVGGSYLGSRTDYSQFEDVMNSDDSVDTTDYF